MRSPSADRLFMLSSPVMTEMIRMSPRLAEAVKQKPASSVWPVFTPSTPMFL